MVIWNLIRRCNLNCKHCYSISADTDFPGELSTDEVFAVMDDLKRFGVPVLMLSGGEPLLRPDIFEVSRRAKDMGFYVGLSTNGTLIDAGNIEAIAEVDRVLTEVLAPLLRRDPEELRAQVCVGSAEHCAELLSSYAAAGCERIYLWPLGDERRQLELVAGEVAPRIAARSR